jgi:hypothetical protein
VPPAHQNANVGRTQPDTEGERGRIQPNAATGECVDQFQSRLLDRRMEWNKSLKMPKIFERGLQIAKSCN